MYVLNQGHLAASAGESPLVRQASVRGWPVTWNYDPTRPEEVARGLLGYLKDRYGDHSLSYSSSPRPLLKGWETHTYIFQLNADSLPARELTGPLVLRIYSSPPGLPRARHEYEVQNHLWDRGFGVPRPIVLEEGCGLFGGPFLLMERVPGQDLVRFLSRNWHYLWPIAWHMAKTHVQLHELPAVGFPASGAPFVTRRLKEINRLLEQHQLPGLLPGLDWLIRHQPPEPARPNIIHLDFHPLNLMRTPERTIIVLDWPEADVGDYHADLGTTALLTDCVSISDGSLFDQILQPFGRTLFKMWYWYEYQKRRSIDKDKLAYYTALATLKRLAGYGQWLDAGPMSTGCKAASLRHLCPKHLKHMQSYFRKWTGIKVELIREG